MGGLRNQDLSQTHDTTREKRLIDRDSHLRLQYNKLV